jgi:cell wall-associated NlpC family hydrolase
MALTVTVGFEAPASAATACHTTFTKYSTIRTGTSGSQARAAQCLLHNAGYSVRADGSFSSADASQLKRFQARHHIAASGTVNASSWTALLSRGSRPTLHYGQRNASVKRLQQSLTASGRRVPSTGYFGPITRNAVKSLQRTRHLSVSGVAGTSVWRALQAGQGVKRGAVVRATPVKRTVVRAAASRAGSSRGARAVSFAKRQLGERYVFGAAGPNRWDCSGLTMAAWRSAGVSLPHRARSQFSRGRKVSKSNLRPGDLVFYYRGIHHVGIYIGRGKIIDAANPRRGVRVTTVSSMPFQGARRMG